ncbi:nitrous oxide reductase accessory protein NosL [Prevotella veroralis]|jgi:nitrous-oxide reductase accessory protein nosL|uniref:nitrous oxide reductase accessory protein NosL n=1 Tax=Prevotella veroralis TaxID=28137 RepID=UPI00036A48AC|nr:nitrous oxide reductase accessory protein NosL [Prevotella veroralis]
MRFITNRTKLFAGATLSIILLSLIACTKSDKPQPIELGKDECAGCGMTIEVPKFACEIISDKGKCFKFDDLSCLFHYMNKQNLSDSTIAKIYVADYEHPDSLIDIKTAGLVLGNDIKSPMNGGVAAFSNHSHAQKFAIKTHSILLDTWERLKVQHPEH